MSIKGKITVTYTKWPELAPRLQNLITEVLSVKSKEAKSRVGKDGYIIWLRFLFPGKYLYMAQTHSSKIQNKMGTLHTLCNMDNLILNKTLNENFLPP